MYGAWPVSTDGWEEVLGFETVGDVIKFSAVAGEEDGAGARAVADAYYVALDVGRAVWGGCERLVVAAGTGGCVGYGGFVPAWRRKISGVSDGDEKGQYLVDGIEDRVSLRRQC